MGPCPSSKDTFHLHLFSGCIHWMSHQSGPTNVCSGRFMSWFQNERKMVCCRTIRVVLEKLLTFILWCHLEAFHLKNETPTFKLMMFKKSSEMIHFLWRSCYLSGVRPRSRKRRPHPGGSSAQRWAAKLIWTDDRKHSNSSQDSDPDWFQVQLESMILNTGRILWNKDIIAVKVDVSFSDHFNVCLLFQMTFSTGVHNCDLYILGLTVQNEGDGSQRHQMSAWAASTDVLHRQSRNSSASFSRGFVSTLGGKNRWTPTGGEPSHSQWFSHSESSLTPPSPWKQKSSLHAVLRWLKWNPVVGAHADAHCDTNQSRLKQDAEKNASICFQQHLRTDFRQGGVNETRGFGWSLWLCEWRGNAAWGSPAEAFRLLWAHSDVCLLDLQQWLSGFMLDVPSWLFAALMCRNADFQLF